MIADLDEAHIELMLSTNHVGRIACCDAIGRPYIVPITYAYADGKIFGHSSEGLKVRLMRERPLVCFEVDQIQDMRNWRSVIAWGMFQELRGEAAAKALDVLLDQVGGIEDALPLHAAEAKADRAAGRIHLGAIKGVIYQISLTEKSGRFEVPPREMRQFAQRTLA